MPLLLLLFKSSAIYAVDLTTKNVSFKGLSRLDPNTLLSSIPIQGNNVIVTKNNIQNIIHSLFSTGNFDEIKVFHDKNKLVFHVKERPIIANILFSGNKYIKDEQLHLVLDTFKVCVGQILNRAVLFRVQKEIGNIYFRSGRYAATIKVLIKYRSNSLVDIKFIIFEGKIANIKQVNILGNRIFSSKDILKNFRLQEINNWYNSFLKNHKFEEQKLIADLNALQKFYFSKGYIRFYISSAYISLSLNKRDVYITIHIHEGDRYKISYIKTVNNLTKLSQEINKHISIHAGKFCNYLEIISVEKIIRQILGNFGYIYPRITTELKINDNNKTVQVCFNINSGNCYYVHEIYFQGNSISKDEVLRREIKQLEGMRIDTRLIQLGLRRLDSLGYFSEVQMKIERVPDSNNQVDIVYIVKERNTGNLNFGIGYSTENGISFQIGASQENFLGTGNILNFNSSKNDHQTCFELVAINPYLTTDGKSIEGHLHYDHLNINSNNNLINFFNKSEGFNLHTNIPIRADKTIGFGVEYLRNNIFNIRPQVAIWRYLNSIGYNSSLYNYESCSLSDLTINFDLITNKLSYSIFPVSGRYNRISSKVTIPGAINDFYKLTWESQYYLPINRDRSWILMNRNYFGYGNGFGHKELPFYENFYAEGSNIIRGFSSRTIGPKAVYYSTNLENIKSLIQSNDAIGGNAIAITNLELITPTLVINNNIIKTVRISLFMDAGTVWDSKWCDTTDTNNANIPNYGNPKYVRVSVGLALQWISPVGPLVFSYAQPLQNYNDKIEQLQFSIGKISS